MSCILNLNFVNLYFWLVVVRGVEEIIIRERVSVIKSVVVFGGWVIVVKCYFCLVVGEYGNWIGISIWMSVSKKGLCFKFF